MWEGKNTFSHSSIIVHICEVVRQNHLSQVDWVYFSQGQESFIRGGKVLSSEMPLLPPFDQWSRFRSELPFLFQHSFNIGNSLIEEANSSVWYFASWLDAVFNFFFLFLHLQHSVGWSFLKTPILLFLETPSCSFRMFVDSAKWENASRLGERWIRPSQKCPGLPSEMSWGRSLSTL